MTMVTDPTLDDDRWGLFVKYKHKFWFEENDYDVPESYFYPNGGEIQPNTIELVKRFLKQIRESRGYDVDCYPPPFFKSPFEPLPLEEMRQDTSNIDKLLYARVVGAAELAIQNICKETGHSYKLVKVERAVLVLTRPCVFFLTLTAEEDGDPVQTIQAEVYHPIGGHPVLQEWRFKPLPAQNACYVAVQTPSKIALTGSKFDADKAKRSIRQPPLYALRAESWQVRDLNIQFASWTQSQLQNHPDERWEDGMQDYLNRAKSIVKSFGDAVNWLTKIAVKRMGLAKIPSEDVRTEPLIDKSSYILFRPTLFLDKPMFPTPWRPAFLYNNNGPFTFGGSEVSVPGIGNANAVTSNVPDGGYVAVQTQRKIAVMGCHLDAVKAESSIRQLPLDAPRAKSSSWHVRALNIQFASWIQSQLQNHPDELWDGVQDYINHAECIMEVSGDATNWLRTNAVKRTGIAKIPSEDARTKSLFGIGRSSRTLFSPTLFSDKPMFPAATTASSGTPWKPALVLNKNDPFTFGGSEVSVPGIGNANAVTSNEPDAEDDIERPSSLSVKKNQEEGIIVVHEVNCELYVKSRDPADQGAWKYKGTGQLRIQCKKGISKGTKESKPTIVILNDVGKLLLDALIYRGIRTIVLKNSVVTVFHTSDDGDSNEKAVARPFLMRTKTEEDRDKLVAAIQEYAPAS